eukprot:2433701-Amphidinium_carterae.1
MLGGDGELIDEPSTVMEDVGRVDDPDTAPPGGSSPGSLIPDQEVLVVDEQERGEQDSESSNDSAGTYATPQWTEETPTVDEDLTWEQEDLEEEAREHAEVTSLPHQPNPMLGRTWLWGQHSDHEMHPDDPANQIMGKGRLPTRVVFPDQWTDRIASKAMPRPDFADLRGAFRGKPNGKGKGSAKGSGPTSFGGSTGSLASQSAERTDEDTQEPTVDEPEPEYHVGMMADEETWNAEWSVADADAGRVGLPDTAPPGGSPPGLLRLSNKPAQAPCSLKDVVHEVEWDGQRWIAVHHANGRSGTYNVSKLAGVWQIAGNAAIYVDGESEDGEFNMSYTLDKDPKSTGLT